MAEQPLVNWNQYEVFAYANCSGMGRALLLCNNSTHFLLAWQLAPDDPEPPMVIETFRYEPVLGAERDVYIEALKAMIALAVRR